MALSGSHARIDKSAHVHVRPNYHIDEFSTGGGPSPRAQPEASAQKRRRSRKPSKRLPCGSTGPQARGPLAPAPFKLRLRAAGALAVALPWRCPRQPGAGSVFRCPRRCLVLCRAGGKGSDLPASLTSIGSPKPAPVGESSGVGSTSSRKMRASRRPMAAASRRAMPGAHGIAGGASAAGNVLCVPWRWSHRQTSKVV
jgi:hypothetical protein